MDLYVDPHEHYNILSAQELLLKGFRITFKDTGVDITKPGGILFTWNTWQLYPFAY